MRQDSRKLEKFLGKWDREAETGSGTQWPSNSQPGADSHRGKAPECLAGGKTEKMRSSAPG